MSHTIQIQNAEPPQLITVTIQNYATGGETVTVAELYPVAGVRAVFFAIVLASQNSLGVPLLPLLNAGKIELIQSSGGSLVEIPTTNSLNAVVNALVYPTGFTV